MKVTFFLTLFCAVNFSYGTSIEEIRKVENPDYWQKLGFEELLKSKNQIRNENVAKNILIFIGDGMGVSTITAARWLKRYKTSKYNLVFDEFPYSALTQVGQILESQ